MKNNIYILIARNIRKNHRSIVYSFWAEAGAVSFNVHCSVVGFDVIRLKFSCSDCANQIYG